MRRVPAAKVAAPVSPVVSKAVAKQLGAYADAETTELARTLFLSSGMSARRVLLTAVSPGGDAEAIGIGLAVTLSRLTTGAVCLIDANLDAGTLDQRLGLDDATGLSEAIAGARSGHSTAQEVPSMPGLWLMPAGSRTRGLRESLGEEDSRRALQAILESFDYVVATCGSRVADAALLGGCFDGVVLILSRQTTTAEATRAGAAELTAAHVPLLGSVISSRSQGAEG